MLIIVIRGLGFTSLLVFNSFINEGFECSSTSPLFKKKYYWSIIHEIWHCIFLEWKNRDKNIYWELAQLHIYRSYKLLVMYHKQVVDFLFLQSLKEKKRGKCMVIIPKGCASVWSEREMERESVQKRQVGERKKERDWCMGVISFGSFTSCFHS